MSVKINNVDLGSCSYNGNEVTEILVNGIQVWQKSSPAIEPAILLYKTKSDMDNDPTGAHAATWSTNTYSGDGPAAYDYFYACYSIAGVDGNFSGYNTKYWTGTTKTDANGRKYLDGEVTTGRSKTGQYIIFTPNNGDPAVRQDFCIISI